MTTLAAQSPPVARRWRVRPYLAFALCCLPSCVGPITTREPTGKVTVKSGHLVATTVEVEPDGTITVTTRPSNLIESAVGGLVGGLAKAFTATPKQ